MRILLASVFLSLVACSSKSEPPPVDDTGVLDAAADADAVVDTGPVDLCAKVTCAAPLGCDKADGKCKPSPKDSKIGGECTSAKDCGTAAGVACLDATADGMIGGYCTLGPCDATNLCPVGSTCAKLAGKPASCFTICAYDGQCRGGTDYKCQDVGSLYVSGASRKVCYLPSFSCGKDEDCPKPQTCIGTPGLCK